MATVALKACIRGRSYLRPPPSAHLYPCRGYGHGLLSSTNPAVVLAPSHDIVSIYLGFRLGSQVSPYLHFTRSILLRAGSTSPSPPRQCYFSTQGGSDEDEELAVDNGTEAGSDEEDGDELELLAEPQTPLPTFSDPVEEAAYIGYKVVGQVKTGDFGPYKPPKAFAVVQVGSHQFKISPGDCIYTEKLKFADVNDKLSLEKVLLLGSKSQTIIGRPLVPKAYVHAAVEEQVLDAKVIVFKKKRRKNYRRCNGHRQELTRLRILEIWGLGEARPTFVDSNV